MVMKNHVLGEYNYALPDELIARAPVTPRDNARVLVYDTKTDTISIDIFKNVGAYIPSHTLFVLNETRVIPARVRLTKMTGGTVEILFLVNERWREKSVIRGLPNKKIAIGETLFFERDEKLAVLSHDAQYFSFRIDFPIEKMDSLLEKYGTTPIPQYIGETPLKEKELRDRYQTVFAHEGASAAAPTASLHFTPSLLSELEKTGFSFSKVRLDVGLGTFASVTQENLEKGRLHTERCVMSQASAQAIRGAKKEKKIVVAVGTTAVRTIESNAENIFRGDGCDDDTDLFIRPPYDFRITDALITNFHLPRTSLMALVDAFLQYKKASRGIIDVYKVAINNHCRFYSFGDAMLIV